MNYCAQVLSILIFCALCQISLADDTGPHGPYCDKASESPANKLLREYFGDTNFISTVNPAKVIRRDGKDDGRNFMQFENKSGAKKAWVYGMSSTENAKIVFKDPDPNSPKTGHIKEITFNKSCEQVETKEFKKIAYCEDTAKDIFKESATDPKGLAWKPAKTMDLKRGDETVKAKYYEKYNGPEKVWFESKGSNQLSFLQFQNLQKPGENKNYDLTFNFDKDCKLKTVVKGRPTEKKDNIKDENVSAFDIDATFCGRFPRALEADISAATKNLYSRPKGIRFVESDQWAEALDACAKYFPDEYSPVEPAPQIPDGKMNNR